MDANYSTREWADVDYDRIQAIRDMFERHEHCHSPVPGRSQDENIKEDETFEQPTDSIEETEIRIISVGLPEGLGPLLIRTFLSEDSIKKVWFLNGFGHFKPSSQ